MNRRALWLFAALFSACAIPHIQAQPTVNSVTNAASYLPAPLPNSPIAQGSIFAIFGSDLGPSSITFATSAFHSTTLAGTSVTITVAGTTVNAPLYYTSATQVAALLPSSTPAGTGTINVTFNNQTSQDAPITIVPSNLGIFTIDSTGTGSGIVTYPDYSLVSPSKATNCGGPNTTCGAANPGDVLILWATGLGPVTGDEVSGAGLGVNMPSLPLKLWIGGVQAPVTYQGRSGCCVAEDQIVFTVPSNVPTGCAVPMAVQIGNEISNHVVIPVAKGSRTCSDPSTAGVDLSQISELSSITFGDVELDHLSKSGGFVDTAQGFFVTIANLPPVTRAFLASSIGNQPVGTCTVLYGKSPGDVFFNNLVNNGYVSLIDGGSSFTVTGAQGTNNVPITGKKTTLSSSGGFLLPGDYTVTGSGGNDIGAFSTQITIPALPALTSPATTGGLTVTRSNGLTVTWNPSGATGHVEIIVSSPINSTTNAQAICTAAVSAGTFNIPAYELLALPGANNGAFFFEPGDVAGPAFATTFPAQNLNFGLAQSFVDGVGFGGVVLK